MTWIHGTREDLERIQSACEAALGYPRMPDFVGSHVIDPQSVEHGYVILESAAGYVMNVDDELLSLASGDHPVELEESLWHMLVDKLMVATDSFEPKADTMP